MSMSKLNRRRAHWSASSSDGEGEDDAQPRPKRSRRALLKNCVLTAIREDIKKEIRFVVAETVREVIKEELRKMNPQLAKPLERTPSRPIEKGDGRNLQLHFKTPLSLPLYTGKQIEGENGAPICIALIDANTGGVVESGPEASVKLDVVVLDGEFVKDNRNEWTREEFENYQMQEREGRAPLLIGDLQVILQGGIGVLGKLKFTDNSSWNRRKTCKIGLKVASGYCGCVRIREAVTEPLRVKDHRGESYEKHYPPKPEDHVWRLKKIGKGGSYHKRLIEARIFVVEDLLQQFVRDPKSLRNMLGGSMTDNKWHELTDHAKTCVQSGKLYVYLYDELMSRSVVFDIIGKLKGVIVDGSFLSADAIPHELMEQFNNLVKIAYDNWDHVKEFKSANYSFPSPVPCISPAGDFRGQEHYLHPSDYQLSSNFGTPAPSELPPGSSGYNEPEAGGSVFNIQNGSQNVTVWSSQMHSLNQMEEAPVYRDSAATTFHGFRTSCHARPVGQDSMDKLPSTSLQGDHEEEEALAFDSDSETLLRSLLLSEPTLPCRSRAAVVSWLRIKAVFRWGFFVRRKVAKVRPTIEQLN